MADPEMPSARRGRRHANSSWLAALVILAFLGSGLAFVFAGGGDETTPKTPSVQEYHLPLKGKLEDLEGWKFIGPKANECVTFEPAGLRITLPSGYAGERPGTGLILPLAVKGDFEMTLDFKILRAPDLAEQGTAGTGLTLLALLDHPEWHAAGLRWRMRADEWGTGFVTWTNAAPAPSFPSTVRSGRLRMVRRGAAVFFSVAEGAASDFTPLCELPFREEDVKEVRIVAFTRGPKASLDAQVSDLHVRWGSVPDPASTLPAQSRWKGWSAVILFLGLLLGLAFLIWLYRRQRPTAADPGRPSEAQTVSPVISFACSHCGENLKARADLAGKKVKCPQCITVVLVPGAEPGERIAGS